ncbi:ferredoxin [Mycolicibacter longobardus]|uniref:Ferredoxin n=1 Tax=Mycolicibacter longobardus TaxID=1108812 RepID=A0A1X1YS14_9MYCO|nr:ferredoxin [Mycolicibacter longobardus]MCV7383293.1 ferredoxin [Mycolicibacter longobardus]ORW13907.1 ferredoxin [Mycolicibacter longobardus]
MKVTADQDICASSGQCVGFAPRVFDQRDEDGVVVLLDQNPPEELADAVRQAVRVCPSGAIQIVEE